MDYRHDIRLKEEADIYSSRVKQEPNMSTNKERCV